MTKEGSSAGSFGGGPLVDLEIRDYLDILRRRKWWVVITAAGFLVTTAVTVLRLPSSYHAETTILVDPQQVSSTYVSPTVTTSVMDRLSTIRQEVLSPTRLTQLVNKLHLTQGEGGMEETGQVVARLQKSITVDVVDAGGQRLSAFRIGYTSKAPVESAQVANELAAAVIHEDLKAREEQFTGTAEFLDSELQDTKKQLEDTEVELGRMKSTYIMDLPESKQFHMEALSNLRNQLQISQDKVNAAQQQKIYLQSMLANSNPVVDLDADGGSGSSPEQNQMEKLETQLSALRARYGPNHPDVRKVEAELKTLKAKTAAEQASEPPAEKPKIDGNTVRNPVIQAQIAKLDQEIADQTKLQPQLQEQIEFHSSKLEQEPIFEERIAGLMRNYDTVRAHYNSLLDKKLSAEMATQLDERQKGERFVVLDYAQIPTRPSGPNRPFFISIGLIVGLLAGIGLAVVTEFSNQSVRNERDAVRLMKKVVLAEIPYIPTEQERRRNKLQIIGALATTTVSSTILGLVISHYAKQFL